MNSPNATMLSSPLSDPPPTSSASSPAKAAPSFAMPTVSTQASEQKAPEQERSWLPYPNYLSTATNGSGPSTFSGYSATTEAILKRVRESNSAQAGMPGWEAAREQVLKNMATSDKILTPPPNSLSKRGRSGGKTRLGSQATAGAEIGAKGGSATGGQSSPTGSATAGARANAGRGRGRGRGKWLTARGTYRGGKRKRDSEDEGVELDDEDEDDDDDAGSDISASYTPQTTITKSGRNVNKPAQYVPVIASPTVPKRKRSYKRNPEASVCKVCHRGHSPGSNQIVFCDSCNTPYHQYCHDPPIEKEFIEVETREWLCAMCSRAKDSAVKDTEGLMAGEGLSIEEKRAYFNTLSSTRLVELLLHATTLQPALPLFPPDARALIPANPTSQQNPNSQSLTQSNQINSNSQTDANNASAVDEDGDTYVDAFDSDPPAHYPKPGNGLARTMRPEAEQLDWLVDYNNEVFEHVVYRDGETDGFPAASLSTSADGNGQATVV